MIKIENNYKIQTPDIEGNYLFKEQVGGVFATEIRLPLNASEWEEVHEAFKKKWEEEHKPEEVQEPEEIGVNPQENND